MSSKRPRFSGELKVKIALEAVYGGNDLSLHKMHAGMGEPEFDEDVATAGLNGGLDMLMFRGNRTSDALVGPALACRSPRAPALGAPEERCCVREGTGRQRSLLHSTASRGADSGHDLIPSGVQHSS